MKSFYKIIRYAVNYKRYALLNIVFNILAVVFELLSMLLFVPFLNILFQQTSETITEKPVFGLTKDYFESYFNYTINQIIVDNDKTKVLLFVCTLVGVLFFLKNVFRYLAIYFIAVLRTGVVKDIRNELHTKILSLPLLFYSEEKKGDIISRVTTDVQEVEWSILNSLELLFKEPISIILSLTVMITMNPELTLFSLILLPSSGFLIGKLGKSLRRTSGKLQSQMGELLSSVEETLGGLRIIKAFHAEQKIDSKFQNLNSDYTSLHLKMIRKRDSASPMSEFLGSTVMVILAYYGGSLVLNGEENFSGGEFIGYIIIFARLLSPIKAISSAYSIIQKGAASVERIEDLMQAENNIKNVDNPKVINQFNSSILYNNVSFAYTNENVLQNITITIEKGKTIALVGESGGGKSTFADLLPRFYDVSSGSIEIDGTNIKNISIDSLRKLIGVVTQESILFNDTIYNNIGFGAENPTEEQIIEAAKIANAHEFICAQEKGYQTNIGDRGNKLSGGQRQRISIARAVLKNPPILILDEATSALDTESEKLVQDALFNLMKSRTSIVIAHRLSTIQNADEIIVLQKGAVVERGTHTELINQQGVYKRLYDLQVFSN
ncbi:MAG: ABC transporter ATP-binding protein [Flavobacteriales bacterium]|nr:ABC transporter ATP-binding protein [Flavobacteriales bacterium]